MPWDLCSPNDIRQRYDPGCQVIPEDGVPLRYGHMERGSQIYAPDYIEPRNRCLAPVGHLIRCVDMTFGLWGEFWFAPSVKLERMA